MGLANRANVFISVQDILVSFSKRLEVLLNLVLFSHNLISSYSSVVPETALIDKPSRLFLLSLSCLFCLYFRSQVLFLLGFFFFFKLTLSFLSYVLGGFTISFKIKLASLQRLLSLFAFFSFLFSPSTLSVHGVGD